MLLFTIVDLPYNIIVVINVVITCSYMSLRNIFSALIFCVLH